MLKAGIIGATGYAGEELVRLLLSHPAVEIAGISSVSFEGQDIRDIYPSLARTSVSTLVSADEVIASSQVVFASLPHGLSEEFAEKTLRYNGVFIDLGADFRLRDKVSYEKWYGKRYEKEELHARSCYALPELNRDIIKNYDIIGNPGCYPTSVALGLMPALRRGLISTDGIIVDSKSGVTGAGRALTQNTHYPDTNEAFAAYKAGAHRHTPEIEQTLGDIAGRDIRITFVPHLLPVNRGIESTIYCKASDGVSLVTLREAYTEAYRDEYFVRVMKDGEYANIRNVRMSNFCDISLHADMRTGTFIICSCIDNMVKGAAGQAIQNMNIRFGLDEREGLRYIPPAF
ncbi:MAG: N-acetyl-gamma-glutamyl-phosphate reductase [Eubacteriales bacterium]